MSKQRFGYADDIESIVDMNKLTIEGGEEMTTNDVVERLNQLEALVDEQNKLLDTLRRKLDELEQETIYKLEADKRLLMHVVHGRAMASSLPKHLKEE